MPGMFHDSTDENGVTISSNSHSAESYSHPLSEQVPARPHWMAGGSGHEGYMEPPAKDLVHKTKDRVFGNPGLKGVDGDLLPRSERIPRKEAGQGVEIHDPSCWCDLCHPSQMAVPAGPARVYRK